VSRLRNAVRPLLVCGLLLWTASFALGQTPEDLFEQGNAAYEQGRYGDAVEFYENLLRYQIEDSRVEYNLANAQFRVGKLGQAILHYERARRLDPLDEDIVANLEFARAQCFDKVEGAALPAALGWVIALQNRIGPDRHAWLFLIIVWALVALVAWCASRPGGWNARAGWTAACLIALLSVACASWYVTLDRLDGGRVAVIQLDAVDVLAGPGGKNAALFTVHEGLTLEIRAEREEWVQVSLPNGLNGWLPRGALEEI